MKKFIAFGLVSIFIAAFWSTHILAEPPKQELSQEFLKQLGQVMADCEAIKPGTTREELERNFTMDGGLCSFSEQRYIHRSCCVKIDVKFDLPAHFPPGDRPTDAWKKSDKIIGVSKPYLERPIID